VDSGLAQIARHSHAAAHAAAERLVTAAFNIKHLPTYSTPPHYTHSRLYVAAVPERAPDAR